MNSFRYLYFINLLTALGTAIVFIPLGNHLSDALGVGGSFSLLLTLSKLPYVVCAKLYVRLGIRFGLLTVIALSQWLAAAFSLLTLAGVYFQSLGTTMFGLTATAFCAAPLASLFPGFLHQHSESLENSKGLFSNWFLIQHLALILSTLLGAYLEKELSIQTIIILDGITFFIAGLGWSLANRKSTFKKVKPDIVFENKQASFRLFAKLNSRARRLQIYNLARNILYGFANPLFPVLVLETYRSGSIQLGYLYLVLGCAALVGGYVARHITFTKALFTCSNFIELVLLLVALIPFGLSHLLGFGAVVVAQMAVNEVLLQTHFFASQPRGQPASTSASFEQMINIGALSGYALFNVASESARMEVLIVLAGLSLIALVAIPKNATREEVHVCAE